MYMMKRTNYTITIQMVEQLNELIETIGGTRSEIVRRAVRELWEREVEARKEGR